MSYIQRDTFMKLKEEDLKIFDQCIENSTVFEIEEFSK